MAKTKMLHDQEFDAYLVDSVSIDDFLLDDEFRRVAADLAYWNAQYSAAVRAWLIARMNRKRVRAERFKHYRGERLEDGKRASDSVVEYDVDADDQYQAAQLSEIEAEAAKEHLRGMADAVAVKKDALQSLGAKLRREMEGDAWLRRQHAAAREHEGSGEG